MTRRSFIGILAFTVVFIAVLSVLGQSERGRAMFPERPAAREHAHIPETLPAPVPCAHSSEAPCADAAKHDEDIASHVARNNRRMERVISIMAARDAAQKK